MNSAWSRVQTAVVLLATGEVAAINAMSSRHGTTSSISSRNTALRVRPCQVQSFQFGLFLHDFIVLASPAFRPLGTARVLNTIPR